MPRWFDAVECFVLVPVEEIQHRSPHACKLLKIAYRCRINVNAANTPEAGLEHADARMTFIETLGSAAEAAEEMTVANLGRDGDGAVHGLTWME
ncbi:hypothetical protein BJL96_21925 [Burkholderia cenocepacia]|nr:hypothetical protein [Burkholderia cenocepacia]